MREHHELYIDGSWRAPLDPSVVELTDPTSGEPVSRVTLGGDADIDAAVGAAERAFASYSRTTPSERIELLKRVLAEYDAHAEDLAQAVTAEVGAPLALARGAHVPSGRVQITTAIEVLETYPFTEMRGDTEIRKEALGVAGLIAPWNFPVLQPVGKTVSALAAGSTVVLKPAQLTPYPAIIWAEILHAAGVPAGVFNLVNGRGSTAGARLSTHPGVGVISFTGSLAAATQVTTAAAPTAKRVVSELGGKAPHILLPDADLDVAVDTAMTWVMAMSGQICSAPTRTIVPRSRLQEFLDVLIPTVENIVVGDPRQEGTTMGPVISAEQWNTVQGYIHQGIEEGARLATGGPGKPVGLEAGHFVKPTVFVDVDNSMTIAREEIFGPLMSVIAYDTVEEAVEVANDTPFGLNAYVTGADLSAARAVAEQIRAGTVMINDVEFDWSAPWGGYKQSGNGREFGPDGMTEYLETKVLRGA